MIKKYLLLILLTSCATQPPSIIDVVNSSVNKHMKYEYDIDQYGVSDKWATNHPAKGDCEDYAIEKAQRLLELGYKPNQLTLYVVSYANIDHAVLLVNNTYILDNIKDNIDSIKNSKYVPHYGCRFDGYRVFYVKSYDTYGYEEFYIDNKISDAPKCEKMLKEIGTI